MGIRLRIPLASEFEAQEFEPYLNGLKAIWRRNG